MKLTETIAKETLVELELILRQQIIELAIKHNYMDLVFSSDPAHKLAGEQSSNGPLNRWTNIIRILSIGNFDLIYLQKELDMKTIRAIHKALP